MRNIRTQPNRGCEPRALATALNPSTKRSTLASKDSNVCLMPRPIDHPVRHVVFAHDCTTSGLSRPSNKPMIPRSHASLEEIPLDQTHRASECKAIAGTKVFHACTLTPHPSATDPRRRPSECSYDGHDGVLHYRDETAPRVLFSGPSLHTHRNFVHERCIFPSGPPGVAGRSIRRSIAVAGERSGRWCPGISRSYVW